MSDTRTIVDHARHATQGPHRHLPADFVPLRLCVETEGVHVELTCPSALLGRHSDAALRIANPEISRRHCQFAFENGKWSVRDLNSLNGVMLNNKPITEATLYAGDRLRLGCVTLLIEAATPMPKEILRQIIDVLPPDQRRAA